MKTEAGENRGGTKEMKKIMIMAAAAIAVLAGCNKGMETFNSEESITFEKGQTVTLNVIAGATETRVGSQLDSTSGDVYFRWQEGDTIRVTVNGESEPFFFSDSTGTNSATFTGRMPAGDSIFSVQYPYTEPDLKNQTYSSTEPIPHDMMKFADDSCSLASPTFTLEPKFAALRLNLYGTDQTISKIAVTNTTSSETYTLNISGGVTLPTTEAAAQAFFIVVPAGDWNFSAEVFDNAATPVSICSFEKTSTDKYFIAKKILNMPAVEVAVPAPSPVISGDFTISAGVDGIQGTSDDVIVIFSKGNLQATCISAGDETTATYGWGFAENQWDYVGDAAGNTTIDTQTVGAVVDLFGWVGASSTVLTSDAQKYGICTSTSNSDYGSSSSDTLKADWANIATLPQISGRKWHTLSWEEWYYLLFTRKVTVNSESKTPYGEGSVNGVNGLIILPDNWGGSVCSGFTYGNSSWSNAFTESTTPTWSEMESAGCVFLPAAGARINSSLCLVGSRGYSWSSTPINQTTYCAWSSYYESDAVGMAYSDGVRYRSSSVRLVSIAQ